MSSSTSIDVNYLSVSNNIWGLFEGSPNSMGTTFPPTGIVMPVNPLSYASILKIADNSNVNLSNLTVDQGSECSLDINNHVIAILQGTFGNNTNGLGNQIVSIKGQSNVTLSGIIRGIGNRFKVHILVSNWSDQAYGGSTVDITNLKHQIAGQKLNIVYRFFADKITYSKDTASLCYFKSACFTSYWWLKYFVRKLMKIKLNEKGPSWL